MKKALEDQKFELIKAHCLNRSDSPLCKEDQFLLDRVMNIAREIDRYPAKKNAIDLQMQKYPEISQRQAYEDYEMAIRLFNTQYSFDFDRWHEWLLQDICDLIKECKVQKDEPGALRAWAIAHTNLIKAIGEKPSEKLNPKLIESNKFIIPIQINNITQNVDLMKFLKIPPDIRKQVTDALIHEISDSETIDIMNT